MGLFSISPHKVTPKMLLAGGILTAEIVGFGFYREETVDVHAAIFRKVGQAVVWTLDAPIEHATCSITSLLPDVEFSRDCVQSWWDGFGDDASSSQSSSVANQPVAQEPLAVAASPSQVSPELNLVDDMIQLGYTCGAPIIVNAVSGDGAIDLMVRGNTSRAVANEAYERGAFSGVSVSVGEAAIVAACS
jgi:hypothetical protein